jgi:hypothetical protein
LALGAGAISIANGRPIGGKSSMPKSQQVTALPVLLALAAALSGCVTAEASLQQPAVAVASAPETNGSAPAPAEPLTREKASTDCWMKYEKDGRGLSLDQRLPLVEKCTAERMKAGR